MEFKYFPISKIFWNRYRIFLSASLIFLLAFNFRLLYLQNTSIDNPIRADAQKYVAYAVNLVVHGVYSQDIAPDPKPDAQVTPGYPLFLAAVLKLSPDFKTFYANVLFLQAIIGAATAVVAFYLAFELLPFWLAMLSGFLTSVSPHLISMGGYLLTETLFTFLLIIAVWVLIVAIRNEKVEMYVLASVFFGLAGLVRPAILLFPAIVSVVLLFYLHPRHRLKFVVLLLSGTILLWLPWTIWSRANTTPTSGKESLALSSLVFGSYPGMVYKNPRLKGFPYREDPEYRHMASSAGAAVGTITKRVTKQPLKYLNWYLLGKPIMFWSWDILVGQGDIYIYPVKRSWYQTSVVAESTRVVMKFLHPFLLILALAGMLTLFYTLKKPFMEKSDAVLFSVLFLLLIYFTAVHSVLAPLPRYSIPLRPILYVASLSSLSLIRKKMKLTP